MPDERTVRAQAVAAIRKGLLPTRLPDRVWGGPGVGAPCTVCDLPVADNDMEFEIQFKRNGNGDWLHACHVHVRCFAAWEFERDTA